MKRNIIILIILVLCCGCSRNSSYLNNNTGADVGFYYTNSENILYEYSKEYGINKVGIEGTQTVSYLPNHEIQLSTNSSFNIMSYSGVIEFHYEPNDQIIVAALDSIFLDKLYYVTSDRQLKKYDRIDNSTEVLLDNIYPLPKQMIINGEESFIYYHTKRNVVKLNLNTLEKQSLLTESIPIQSIAVCESSKMIYISSSVDGKIYQHNQQTNTTNVFHHTMSAAGSSIWLDKKREELYFSRSNGRDIEIKKINVNSKSSYDVITLKNIFYINNLVIKD